MPYGPYQIVWDRYCPVPQGEAWIYRYMPLTIWIHPADYSRLLKSNQGLALPEITSN